jgi:hypothetical protein
MYGSAAFGTPAFAGQSPPKPSPGSLAAAPPVRPAPAAATPPKARTTSKPPPSDEGDIAIPLTRRAPSFVEIGPPAVERPATTRRRESDPVLDLKQRDPVLDLKRRKPGMETIVARVPLVKRPRTDPPPPPEGRRPDSMKPVRRSTPPPPPVSRVIAPEPESVVDQMLAASDRDEILDLLVAGTRTVAMRAAVFAVRKDALTGWTGSREVADRPALRAIRLANNMPTVLHEALERDGTRLVRIPMDAAHAPFVAVMRSPPSGQAVVAAVHADGKAVAVVFADGLADTAAALDRVSALARAAGESLGRLLREKRDRTK